MDLLEQTTRDHEVQVVIVSEPNVRTVTRGGWIVDRREDVAVNIYTSNCRIGESGVEEGFVWVQIEDFHLYGCYCSPNRERDVFEEMLDNIKRHIRRISARNVIIGGDFNAKNTRWGAPETEIEDS